LEELERRDLLSATWPGLTQPVPEVENNDTLDQAQNLGLINPGSSVGVVGVVGNSPAGAADVDFYQFTLNQPAHVQIATLDRQAGSPFVSVLSLYNTDPQDPMGNRLIAQSDGAATGGDASLTQTLGAGTYYVAVSGSGNRYFYPYLADSGYPGSTGPYGLSIQTTPTGIQPGDGPAVLASDPAPGSHLASSPFQLRVALSGPVDPSTLLPGDTVDLRYSPDGSFSGKNVTDLSGGTVVGFDQATNQIVVTPPGPLAPGYYQVFLAGNAGQHTDVLLGLDANSTPLGENSLHPHGQDGVLSFQVTGGGAHDTPATAYNLGDITGGQFVQLAGAIGNDPTYQPSTFNPSQVNLYHFRISSPANYAFAAEVFAGRIDSPLDPALTLFQQGPTGSLQFVASNGNTDNGTVATNGAMPLFTDAALFTPLSAGDYYLAVSSGFNYVDPAGGLVAGQYGVFDPTVSHSGSAGNSIGNYVLNLQAEPSSGAPHVVSTSLPNGTTLDGPPTALTVTFSAPVNVAQLAFDAYNNTSSSKVSSVFIQAADGTKYFPRLLSYDPTSGQATFRMIDGLPPGSYALHLSGPLGLTDLAGNPLLGNDPSGDYVTHFTVGGSERGSPANPTAWVVQQPSDDFTNPQDLGTLFPMDLQNGVTITRPTSASPVGNVAGATDYYRFSVLQSQDYLITLPSSTGLPAGTTPAIWCSNGAPVSTLPQGPGAIFVQLDPGTYVVGVSWDPNSSAAVNYQLQIDLLGSAETAVALTTGPAPVLSVRLVSDAPAAPGPTSEPVPVLRVGDLPPVGTTGTATATVPQAPSPIDLFVALADRPLGPGGAGAFTGGPDSTQVARVDAPGVNPFALFPLMVLSVQTVTVAGGTSEPEAEPPASPPLGAGPSAVRDWLAGLIPSAPFAAPMPAFSEAVQAVTQAFGMLGAWWNDLPSSPSEAPAASPPAGQEAGTLTAGPSAEQAPAPPAVPVVPVSGSSRWDLPRSLTWMVAFCSVALGLLHGRRRVRKFRRGAKARMNDEWS
jgi:hypothetical protein